MGEPREAAAILGSGGIKTGAQRVHLKGSRQLLSQTTDMLIRDLGLQVNTASDATKKIMKKMSMTTMTITPTMITATKMMTMMTKVMITITLTMPMIMAMTDW